MSTCPLSKKSVAIALSLIHGELVSMLGRYLGCDSGGSGAIHLVPDIIVMHDCVWGAVELLNGADLPDARYAESLSHLYRTKRTEKAGMVTFAALAGMTDVIAIALEEISDDEMGLSIGNAERP